MIASTLTMACQAKANAAAQGQLMNIKPHQQGWQLVNRMHDLTLRQRAGLAMAYEWHRAFPRNGFHPIQFEIYGIQEKGLGPALATEMQQLGLLQSREGRFWISQAGLNMMKMVEEV